MSKFYALLLFALLLSGCSATRLAKKARQAAGEAALRMAATDAAKTPEAQLVDLYARNPELARKSVVVARKTDTVRVAETRAALEVAPVADARADRALADTLLGVLRRLSVVDSSLTDVQQSSAAEALAHKLSSSRPTYPLDTQRVEANGTTLEVWFDRRGKLYARARTAERKIAVVTETLEARPVREPTTWESLKTAFKIWYWLVIAGLGAVLFFIILRRRRRANV